MLPGKQITSLEHFFLKNWNKNLLNSVWAESFTDDLCKSSHKICRSLEFRTNAYYFGHFSSYYYFMLVKHIKNVIQDILNF